VRFRSADELTEARLNRYLEIEQPFDCAGAAKSEALGITLIESLEGPDPTALIGLPLIALSRLLRDIGFDPLQPLSGVD
jgi:septum formation protein